MHNCLSNETLLLIEADLSEAEKDRSVRATKRKNTFKARRREIASNRCQYNDTITPGAFKKYSGIPCHPGKNPYKKYNSRDRRHYLRKDLRKEIAMADDLMTMIAV